MKSIFIVVSDPSTPQQVALSLYYQLLQITTSELTVQVVDAQRINLLVGSEQVPPDIIFLFDRSVTLTGPIERALIIVIEDSPGIPISLPSAWLSDPTFLGFVISSIQ